MSKLAHALQKRFIRFAGSSLISTVVDQAIAWTLFYVLKPAFAGQDYLRILVGSVVARVCSVAVNFTLNQKRVFVSVDEETGKKSADSSARRTLPRFIATAVLILLLSTIGVWALHSYLGAPEGPAKIVVDLCLFFLNYAIQRKWVFKPAE